MEDLLKRQYVIIESIKSMKINFGKDSASRKTPEYLETKLNKLEDLWVEFEINNQQLSDSTDKADKYFIENKFEQTRELYEIFKALLLNYSRQEKAMASKIDEANNGKQERGVNSKIDELMSKQRTNFRALIRLINSIDIEKISDKWEIEDELRNLQSRWNVVDTLHLEIDEILQGSDPKYEDEYSQFEVRHKNMKRALNNKLSSTVHTQQSTPRLEIPVFYGNYSQWPSFYDLFCETIHNSKTLTNTQKMQHLKSLVKGEAARLIQHLHISSENYQTALDILIHRFENKQRLFTTQIELLLNQPTIQRQNAFQLKRLHDTSVECIHAIHNLGVNTNTWDPLLVHLLSKKLDAETLKAYKEARKSPRELPDLTEFISFLEEKFIALEEPEKKERQQPSVPKQNISSKPSSSFPPKGFHREKYQGKTYHTRATKCPLCNYHHDLFQCKKFINMTSDTKLKEIAKHKICKNCLYKHNDNPCTSTKRCKTCNGEHNSLLHEAFAANSTATSDSTSQVPIMQHNVNHVAGQDEEILLTTVQLNVLSANGTYITLRALLDQGSQISLISERAAQILGLQRQPHHASVSGIGNGSKQSKGLINITCRSIHDDYHFTTRALIISKVVNNLPNNSFSKRSWPHLHHVNLADPDYNISRPIDLLLDASVYSDIIMSGLIKGPPQSPIAQQTKLGWILCGSVKTFNCHVVINNLADLSKYWEMEEITAPSIMSSGDQYCEDVYQSTTKRLENGMYEVAIPMKPDFEKDLGTSKPKALAQFSQLERKMANNNIFGNSYKGFMDEYLELGHMQPSSNKTEPTCYLPHHGVLKLDSTSTKLRVVFNASSKTSTGYSLNDLMEQGPNLQADLQNLIICWRQYKYVMTADIEKMFRRILVSEEFQSLQSIIWRGTSVEPLRSYQLTTVTYGTKAAPFLAMRTLKQLAKDDADKFPLGSMALSSDFYMDDYLGGSNCLETAKEIQKQLIATLSGAGMNLRKWSSNVEELVQDLSQEQLNSPYEFRCTESRKTLGLKWNPTSDSFTFDNKQFEISENKRHTKRELLSDISRIFDPIGWLSPLTIKAKLLFQKAWATGMTWDDELSQDIIQEWMQLRNDLQNINQMCIPRYLGNTEKTYHLHGFSDASEKAYACAIYCVSINDKGEYTRNLVAAKTKLAPLNKKVTLPRLELCGAVLLSSLMQKVTNALSLSNRNSIIHAWTDSMIVLGWIHGDQSRWKQFVANRTQQIKDIIPAEQWHHVRSEDNPADSATRGLNVIQLLEHRLWWEGPEWLPTFENNITPKSYQEPTIETKKLSVTTALCKNQSTVILELLNQNSSITRIAKIIAWVSRFIKRTRDGPGASTGSGADSALALTPTELNEAYNSIIKTVQALEFCDELENIKTKGHVHKSSKLASLNPFIDDDGLLRVGGRLDNSIISWQTKHPIILSSHSRLTDLIINQAHVTTLHGGARLTLSYIRNKYWILSGMRTVKRNLRQCVKCRRFNQKNYQPIMADLPKPRVVPSRPFTHTGVDFTGQFELKLNKGRGVRTTRGYVSIFVCLSTKAVHLELVSDLSTPAFLGAFRRFSSRRGVPRDMYSDNGTNFVGANKILKKEYQEIIGCINKDFFDNIAEMNVKWHFNAPAYPSAGGLWEAAVKSLKYHLKRVIGDQRLTYEEFNTVLHQVEACMNSRPLSPLTEDAEDGVLTPGHFLVGGPLLVRPDPDPESLCLSKRWQLLQHITNQFWKRWSSEYLQQLQTRTKWRSPDQNIKINDIVLVKEDNLPPGKWAMGRVQETHPGKDGHVRVVSLKTKNNIIRRPVIKLVPLLVDENQKEDKEQAASGSNDTQSTESTRARRHNARRGPNVFKNFFLTVCMTLSMLISPTLQQGYNVTSLTNDQGFYFDKISNLQYVREEWKLIMYYNMSTYWQGLDNIHKYVAHIKEAGPWIENTQYETVILQLEHELDEIEHYNKLLRTPYIKRQKRGLIDGVGYVANSLFGVLDARFADQYQKDIEKVTQNENHLRKLIQNQTIIIEAEYNILKRHEYIMNKHFTFIENHINNLTVEVDHIRVDLSNGMYIVSSTLAAQIIISNIRQIQQTLIDTVTDINHGHINTYLISPEQLEKQINTISSHLQGDLTLPLDLSNIMHLYKLLRVSARITEKYLIIEIKIPLLSTDIFELNKIISIPQKREENFYQIKPTYPYIGFNVKKDAVLFLSDLDVNLCRHFPENKLLCSLDKPVYTMNIKQSLCDIQLIDSGTSPCTSEMTSCKESWTKLHADNSWLFSCCAECGVRIICPDGVSPQALRGSGVIHLGPMCTMKGNDFTIYSHNNFYSKANINQRIQIPEVSILNKLINTSASAVINITDDGEHLFRVVKTQIEKLKEDQAKELNVHDIHHYSVGYFIIAILLIVATIIAYRRLKRRCLWCPRAGAEPAARQQRQAGATPPPPPTPPARTQPCAAAPRCESVSEVLVNERMSKSVASVEKATSPMVISRKHEVASE